MKQQELICKSPASPRRLSEFIVQLQCQPVEGKEVGYAEAKAHTHSQQYELGNCLDSVEGHELGSGHEQLFAALSGLSLLSCMSSRSARYFARSHRKQAIGHTHLANLSSYQQALDYHLLVRRRYGDGDVHGIELPRCYSRIKAYASP